MIHQGWKVERLKITDVVDALDDDESGYIQVPPVITRTLLSQYADYTDAAGVGDFVSLNERLVCQFHARTLLRMNSVSADGSAWRYD